MTEITHLYKFIPKGSSDSNPDRYKNIPCRHNSMDPKNGIQKAYDNMKILIDNYAVRNHWTIHSAVSTYVDKPWTTSIRFNREVSNFGFVDKLETKREDDEVYHVVKTDKDKKEVRDILNSYYQQSKDYKIESTKNGVIVYDQWMTHISQP